MEQSGQGRQDERTTGDPGSGNTQGGPRSRRGWIIGSAIALALLFLTAGAITLVLIASPGGSGGGGAVASTSEDFREEYVSGEGSDKIAVVPVSGVIGPDQPQPSVLGAATGATPEVLRDQLRKAADDSRVRAVILEIDSPGGSVVPTDQMHRYIQDFKNETGKPVIVSMGQTAASGGYYIATAADRIVANDTTLTGSLGVIFSYLNLSEAAADFGVEEEVIKSGPYKDIASATREPTEEELEILQAYVDEGYDKFVQVIVEGRRLSEDRVRELADGRIYSGLQAEALGLVDDLGDLDRATEVSRDLADLEQATVVRYERRPPGLSALLQARLDPSSEPEALKTLRAAGLDTSPDLKYLYRP